MRNIVGDALLAAIPRPRLIARLSRAAKFPLTLVVAPEGFGKTVAIDHYLAAQRSFVRFEVTQAQGSLAGFLRGLAQSLAEVAPGASRSFAVAHVRAFEAGAPIATLAAWLEAHLEGIATTLVIEDVHHAREPHVAEFLCAFAERMPAGIRLIVSSRDEPQFPLPSWLATELTALPLDADELRFTYDEALEYARAMRSDLPPSRLRALLERTAGWPAAFAHALRDPQQLPSPYASDARTRADAMNALTGARFRREDAKVRDFMLHTSCYERFDFELLRAAGWTHAGEVVAHLASDGVTLVRRGDSYRYAAALRTFLVETLVAQGAYTGVLRAAAEALERAGRDAEALPFWLHAADPSTLRAVLARSGFAALDAGYADDVSKALAIATNGAQPWAAGIALKAALGAPPAPRAARRAAFVEAPESSSSSGEDASLAHRFALELARCGDYAYIEMLEPFAQTDGLPRPLRASMCALLAGAYLANGAREAAQRTIRAALSCADEADRGEAYARVMYFAAKVAAADGDSGEAARYARLCIEAAVARGAFELAANAYGILHALLDDAGDAQGAALLARIAQCGVLTANSRLRLRALAGMYESEIERGCLDRLDELERDLTGTGFDEAEAARVPGRAARAAWRGDFAGAYAILAGAPARSRDVERRALCEAERALYAAASNNAESAAALADAREALREGGSSGSGRMLRARAYVTLATLVLGRTRNAEAALADFERATGSMNPLLRAVRVVFDRWEGSARAGAMQAAFDDLRSANLGGTARLLEALTLPGMVRAEVGRLTGAEHGILLRIAAGLTSKAIAAESGRSVQTVNVHVKAICRKLNCSGRRQALSVALGQGLIAQVPPAPSGRLEKSKRGKRPRATRRS